MAAPVLPSRFDPLVELAGLWTAQMAERYLPIEGMPPAKYECLDGNLIMSPYEGTAEGYAAVELVARLRGPVRKAGHRLYSTVNVQFGPQRWIQPDLTVLSGLLGV